MFIQTEVTPNPETLKFVPGREVLLGGTREFVTAESAAVSPLAAKLFEIDGVAGVFFGQDFITVTKSQDEWSHLKPSILGAIMDHFTSGDPLINEAESDQPDEEYDESDKETVLAIKELLETRVRPAVAQDGGDIMFHSYKEGVVSLHMRGACAGCPSSTATLKQGIENLLKHFIPEVQEVRAV